MVVVVVDDDDDDDDVVVVVVVDDDDVVVVIVVVVVVVVVVLRGVGFRVSFNNFSKHTQTNVIYRLTRSSILVLKQTKNSKSQPMST